MDALVIGSTSVLARATTRRLRRAGHKVLTAGRREADLPLDLLSESLPDWADRLQCDVVVNFAAAFGSADASDFVRTTRVNAIGPVVAAAVAVQAGAGHIIQLSSHYAGHLSFYAGDPLYPLTKRHGEELLAEYARNHQLRVTVLRPTHVYDDEGECRPHQSALYRLIDEARAGGEVLLHNPDGRRDYLHIDDLSASIAAAIENPVSGTFPVSSPGDRSFRELGELAIAATGGSARIRDGGDGGRPPPPDAASGLAAASAPERFRASIGIEEGISRIVKAQSG